MRGHGRGDRSRPTTRALRGRARPVGHRAVRGGNQRHEPVGPRRRRGAGDVPGDPDLRRAVGRQRGGAQVGVPERTQRGARRARGAVAPSTRARRSPEHVLRTVRGAQYARRRARHPAPGAVRRRRRARGRALVDHLLPRLRPARRRGTGAARPHLPRGGARAPRGLGHAARRRRHRHSVRRGVERLVSASLRSRIRAAGRRRLRVRARALHDGDVHAGRGRHGGGRRSVARAPRCGAVRVTDAARRRPHRRRVRREHRPR